MYSQHALQELENLSPTKHTSTDIFVIAALCKILLFVCLFFVLFLFCFVFFLVVVLPR